MERKTVLPDVKSGKAVDNRHAVSAHVGSVDPVTRIVAGVHQVSAQAVAKVLFRLFCQSGPGYYNAEDAGGQRGIVRGDLLIILQGSAHDVW